MSRHSSNSPHPRRNRSPSTRNRSLPPRSSPHSIRFSLLLTRDSPRQALVSLLLCLDSPRISRVSRQIGGLSRHRRARLPPPARRGAEPTLYSCQTALSEDLFWRH